MSGVSKAQKARAQAQAELDATVAELSDRLDPVKSVKRNPGPWIAAGAGVVGLIVGGIVLAARSRSRNR